MSTNQQIILQTLVEQQHQEIDPSSDLKDFFNIFSIEQILKDNELSYDEIKNGITEGGGDGGVDGIYTFVNDILIPSSSDIVDTKRKASLELVIIQSKFVNGFSEGAIEKLNSSATEILDLSKDIDSLRAVYNVPLLKNIKTFREQFKKIISKFPSLKIKYYYSTKGEEIHPNVERKIDLLKATINRLFSDAEFTFEFITASKLLELSRKEQTKVKGILLKDNPISTEDGGYVAIASLKSYYDFITENNDLINYFFDANVRDYQGGVEVNKGIRETLNNPSIEDFWWLNNGITITATKATLSGKQLTVEDPQIVNGLQTSFELYNYIKKNPEIEEARNILLRVIKTDNEKSRLKVIRATNSQTKVPLSSLRATEEIHKDIEDYLLTKGFFYDRRKNYYKNHGKPLNQIVSISYLAQCIMSIVLQEPDYARARPSTLLKNDSDYKRVFNKDYPIDLFLKCIELTKLIEENLKKEKYDLSKTQIGDIKFHCAVYLSAVCTSKMKPRIKEIITIDTNTIEESKIEKVIEDVNVLYDSLGGTNAVAKGKEFINELKDLMKEEYGSQQST